VFACFRSAARDRLVLRHVFGRSSPVHVRELAAIVHQHFRIQNAFSCSPRLDTTENLSHHGQCRSPKRLPEPWPRANLYSVLPRRSFHYRARPYRNNQHRVTIVRRPLVRHSRGRLRWYCDESHFSWSGSCSYLPSGKRFLFCMLNALPCLRRPCCS
jgi:hypothetical protein